MIKLILADKFNGDLFLVFLSQCEIAQRKCVTKFYQAYRGKRYNSYVFMVDLVQNPYFN